MESPTGKLTQTSGEIYRPASSWEETWGSGQILGIGHVLLAIVEGAFSLIPATLTSWQWSATCWNNAFKHGGHGLEIFFRHFPLHNSSSSSATGSPKLEIAESRVEFEHDWKPTENFEGMVLVQIQGENSMDKVTSGSVASLIATKELVVAIYDTRNEPRFIPLIDFCNGLKKGNELPKLLAQTGKLTTPAVEIKCDCQTCLVTKVTVHDPEARLNVFGEGFYLVVTNADHQIIKVLEDSDEVFICAPGENIRIAEQINYSEQVQLAIKKTGYRVLYEDQACFTRLLELDEQPTISAPVRQRMNGYIDQKVKGKGIQIDWDTPLKVQLPGLNENIAKTPTSQSSMNEASAITPQEVENFLNKIFQDRKTGPALGKLKETLANTTWKDGFGNKIAFNQKGEHQYRGADEEKMGDEDFLAALNAGWSLDI